MNEIVVNQKEQERKTAQECNQMVSGHWSSPIAPRICIWVDFAIFQYCHFINFVGDK